MRMRKGFTLVELAIVLVIIGFLIAMGVKGTELIKEARAQKEAYKFNKISAAIGTIYNKYGYLPYDGWNGKYSAAAGELVRTPKDGVIQFWESGGFSWSLRSAGILNNEDLTIMDTPTFFSSGGWVGIDHPNQNNWTTVIYFDPGTVWNGGDVTESADFGTGPWTALVLAQYDSKQYTFKEDTRTDTTTGTCDDDCTDGYCDINRDGDCTDQFTYWQPSKVRGGPGDEAAYMLDKKGDASTWWYGGNLRSALRYDSKNDTYYRLNKALSDADSDKRPEIDGQDNNIAYWDNTRNRNFVAYKIW